MALSPIVEALQQRLLRVDGGGVLNRLSLEPLPPPEPELAEALRRAALTMEAQAFDPATGLLDYAQLAGSASLQAYRKQARALWAFDPSVLETPSQRLAFWINLYNALMVDAVISFEVKRTVREIPGIFWRAAYGVGGRRYSLDDIEHGILRSNAGHPAIPGARFSAADPRQRFVLPCLEPRIHYALNCASRSCPPIAFYQAENLEGQLDMAARSFLRGGGARLGPDGSVELSRIFQWYAPDFGGHLLGIGSRRALMRHVAPFMDDPQGWEAWARRRGKLRFLPYDWSLNKTL